VVVATTQKYTKNVLFIGRTSPVESNLNIFKRLLNTAKSPRSSKGLPNSPYSAVNSSETHSISVLQVDTAISNYDARKKVLLSPTDHSTNNAGSSQTFAVEDTISRESISPTTTSPHLSEDSIFQGLRSQQTSSRSVILSASEIEKEYLASCDRRKAIVCVPLYQSIKVSLQCITWYIHSNYIFYSRQVSNCFRRPFKDNRLVWTSIIETGY
jgi:hypothetical protein